MPDCTMCLDCFGHDNDTEYTAGFRAGAANEQQRIIDLLRPLGCDEDSVTHDCSNALGYRTAQNLIDLITGKKEKNE